MPGVVRDFIRKYIDVLDAKTLFVAIRDIDDALRIDTLDDADEWRMLRDELQTKLEHLEVKSGHG